MLSQDIDERQLTQVVPVLMPELLDIVSSGRYNAVMQHKALSILRGLLVQLGVLSGAFQRQVRDLMVPLLIPWLPVLSSILGSRLTQAPSCWALKQEALQVVVQLVSFFSKPLQEAIASLLAPCWLMFVGGVPVYQMTYMCIAYMQMTATQVESWASNANAYVADEEEETFTARVSGELLLEEIATSLGGSDVLMEVFTAVEQRFRETAEPTTRNCIQIGSRRISHSCKTSWQTCSADAGSDDDGIGRAVLMREAAMVALGVLAPHITQLTTRMKGSIKRGRSVDALDVKTLLSRMEAILSCMIKHDLQRAHKSPFLAGRALWAASKFSSLLDPAQADVLLQAACAVLTRSAPAVLQGLFGGEADRNVGAAAGAAAAAAKLAPFLPHLYSGLVLLLGECCDESLHLVLETLAVVLRLDPQGAVVLQYLPQVASPVLDVWAKSVADPLIGEDALSVLGVIAQQPACLQPLAQQLLPTLASVVSNPESQSSIMLEGCLQMLRLLVLTPKRVSPEAAVTAAVLSGMCPLIPSPEPTASPEQQHAQHELRSQQIGQLQQQVQQQQHQLQLGVAQQVHVSVLQALLRLISSCDDPGVQQSAQQLLCQLIRTGRADLLSWGGADPQATLRALVVAAQHLLQPGIDEGCGALAGELMFEMLTAFPAQLMAPYLPELLKQVVSRLVTVNLSPLVCGLLLVMARLAHSDHNAFITTLASMSVTLPGGQTACAFDASLAVWLDRCGELQGRYHLTLAVTALGLLLESSHPRLEQVMVKGKRLDVQQGVKTRSQVQAAGGKQHNMVPAPLKILALMGDLLADVQETGDCIRGTGSSTDDSESEGEEEGEAFGECSSEEELGDLGEGEGALERVAAQPLCAAVPDAAWAATSPGCSCTCNDAPPDVGCAQAHRGKQADAPATIEGSFRLNERLLDRGMQVPAHISRAIPEWVFPNGAGSPVRHQIRPDAISVLPIPGRQTHLDPSKIPPQDRDIHLVELKGYKGWPTA
ncbi:armadillo-type protein [Dunaliella salina]|uniref:Armadillo-type protein n=1 Tax=Dunaliella salina TaxID=3046 RepID=A0ABQ7GXC8_DUNSA|nr:armadillo-type protein [Dunaliella salina]|eukprot:KAF5839257.1 armadillo-type protein [Dunaliella salina]